MGDSRSYEEIKDDAIDKQKHAIQELFKNHNPELKEKIIESITDRQEMIDYIDTHMDQ
ncbi:hypothetical protein [Defluviitalea saccharophila]|uniref:Uncharacterized protein n=1 Tax=Defluviitalea saccharophila TaxID=879970 RepID=A0ABZ2Y484_9FIRM|nr:hypothetical protein [Candidatus Epulonipiscium sp.]